MDTAAPPVASARLGIRGLQVYHLSDQLSGGLLLGMLIISPWWFGTTQPHAISVMNWAGAGLWGLLILKRSFRWCTGYVPPRWDNQLPRTACRVIRALGLVTALVLSYMLLSALNPRATYDYTTATFHYRECRLWLPHSYHPQATWQVLTNYTALAGVFWALRDWLAGRTPAEARARRQQGAVAAGGAGDFLPTRLRLLLWVLCLNGGLLAAQGIAQRLSGEGKLLWLIEPRINKDALSQFGPFAYRANAAQYFNLLWPVALGFWWTRQRRTPGEWRHHSLLLAATLLAAAPFISTARGGAMVAGSMLVAAALWFALIGWMFPGSASPAPSQRRTRLAFGLFFIAVGLLIQQIGWDDLSQRMNQINEGLDNREQIYAAARRMARDYRWWGTGPGSLNALYALYRGDPTDYWPAQLHNDWLEFRITFGRVGFALILTAMGLVLARGCVAGGLFIGRRLTGMLWLALLGTLVQARFDFPFLIYSILMLTLAYGAILSLLGGRSAS
jgi:hypothetical protein